MFKRVTLIFLVVGTLILLTAGYFYMRRVLKTGTNPINAVAPDAAVIVRTGSVSEFLTAIRSDPDLWSELGTVLNSHNLEQEVIYLDSLFNNHMQVPELAGSKDLIFSLHPAGRNKYLPVFYSRLSSLQEARVYNEIMFSLLEGHARISERIYDRVKVYDVQFSSQQGERELSWAISDGVFILSPSPVLVENSIRQLFSGTSLLEDDAFNKVLSTSGSNVDANVFFNLRLLPRYISSFTGDQGKTFLSGLPTLGNWAELDLHLRDNALLLNGFSFSDNSQNNYLNIFGGQSPEEIMVESVIPSYSSAFLAMGLTEFSVFHKKYLAWLEGSGNLDRHNELNREFINLTGSDPADAFGSFLEREVALVMSDWDGPEEEGQYYLLLNTMSRSQAEKEMLGMLEHHAALSNINTTSYRNTYSIDSETSFDIYDFPYDSTGELLFGGLFGTAKTSYFTFVGNYLVFGESVDGLSEFIRANVLNQTLSADKRFMEFSEYLSSRNNLYFYSNVSRSTGIYSMLFNEKLTENLSDNLDSFRKFQGISLQFSSGKEMIYNNIFLKYSPEIVEEAHTQWQTLLDTIIDFKPEFLLNHNTGDNEIFVQDISNNIYLINKAGRILWKKPVDGKIMGSVHQIDYFNNDRLQILFNTREQIYLIDRNGNDVDRYPIRLPSPATNGISVFDYENNKDYRIFVASEDKSVVARSGDGRIVEGWDFQGTEHNVYHDIRYISSEGRDYIVFADRNRVYMLDRRGNTRVSPDKVFPVSERNNIQFEGRTPASDPRLALTDTTGVIWHIYFDGRTETIKLGDYSAGHFFDFKDMDADGYRDYIITDDNRVEVFDREGSPMFSHEFPVPIKHTPSYYYFSRSDRKLGFVGQGQIYLLNSDGELFRGFPLQGRSHFTIGFLQTVQGNFQLIVGSNNNFLYNYSVYRIPG